MVVLADGDASCAEAVLWPSGSTSLLAQPDSSIAPLPDGSMEVKTGAKYSWPGVRLDFAAGECDLTPYGSVKVAVSNTTDKPLVVHLSVKGQTVQGQMPGGLAGQGLILAVEAVVGELRGEGAVGRVVLRGDQQAGAVLVDAVDDAGPLLPADAGERVAAVPEQGVDQSAVRMAGSRVHDHAARLVDHDEVRVLVHHVEREVLRDERDLLRRGDDDLKTVARRAAVVLFDRRAAEGDKAALQQALGGAAGKTRYMAREESVDAIAALLCA